MEIKINKARNSLLVLTLLMPNQLNLELLGGQNVKNIEVVENVFNKQTKSIDSINEQIDAAEKASKFFERVQSVLETEKAIDLYEEMIKRHEKKLGSENLEFAEYLNILGMLYGDQGLYEKAEPLFLRSNLITERILGADHEYTGIGIYNLASLYEDQELYEKAIDSSLKSLSIMEKNFGKEDLKLVRHLSQLAGLYQEKGLYDKAILNLEKGIKLEKKFLGENHPDLGDSYNWMGDLYLQKDDYEKAKIYILNGLKIRKLYQEKSPLNLSESYEKIGELYASKSDYLNAEKYYLDSLNIKEKVYKDNKFKLLDTFLDLGIFYKEKGDFNKAEKYFLKTLEISKDNSYEYKDIDIHYNLLWLGDLYKLSGDSEKAEYYYLLSLKELDSIKKEEDKQKLKFQTYYSLGEFYTDKRFFNKALDNAQNALKISLDLYDIENQNHLKTLDLIGKIYAQQTLYSKAEEYFLKSYNIKDKYYKKNDISLNNSLINLGEIYLLKGFYKKGEESFLNALQNLENYYGENHHHTSPALAWLGEFYRNLGSFEKAKKYYLKALLIDEKHFGENSIQLSRNIYWLGYINAEIGMFEKAKKYYERNLSILVSHYGQNHFKTANILNWIGDIYEKEKEYKTAEDYYLKSFSINENYYGLDNPVLAINYIWLGKLYIKQGLFKKAQYNFSKSLELREKYLGKNNLDTLASLKWLGKSLYEQLLYQEAEKLYLEALAIEKDLLGDNHPQLSETYISLGDIYKWQDLFKLSNDAYSSSLKINKLNYGEIHPSVGEDYIALGSLHEINDDYKKAEKYYKNAIKISEKIFGKDSYDYSRNLEFLASFYEKIGSYKKAEKIFLEVLATKEKQLGISHPYLSFTLDNLGKLKGLNTKNGEENIYYRRLINNELLTLQRETPYMSLEDRQNFVRTIDIRMPDQIYGEAINSEFSTNRNLALFLRLNRHGLLEEIEKRQSIITNLSTEGEKISQQLKAVIQDLASKNIEDSEFNKLSKKKEKLEKKLYRIIPRIEPRIIEIDQIAKSLPANSVLIEFQKYYPFKKELYWGIGLQIEKDKDKLNIISITEGSPAQKSGLMNGDQIISINKYPTRKLDFKDARELIIGPKNSKVILEVKRKNKVIFIETTRSKMIIDEYWEEDKYIALLIKPNGETESIDLGESKYIDEKIGIALDASEKGYTDAQDLWDTITNLVFSPLSKSIENSEILFISPDSELNRIAYSALRSTKDKKNFLTDDFKIRLLTTGRELLNNKNNNTENNSLIVANPDFNKNLKNIKKDNTVNTKQLRSGDLIIDSWEALPGTIKEGKVIASLIRGDLIQGKNATAMKIQEEKNPKIIHIASHSYFLEDENDEDKKLNKQKEIFELNNKNLLSNFKIKDNPLLRSGVVLAGANNPNINENDDGYLTALEITKLNWEGTELAVISGCESGLGEIKSGEGVYGLKRAISVAGAKSSLLSLWKVNDLATAEFMETYYRKLKNGEGKAEALHNTQKEFRNSDIEGYRHPYYWAAFQLSGDWRPIDF